MTIFKTFTLKWWEGSLFKWGMLALGLAAGAYWHNYLNNFIPILIAIAVFTLSYITYIWWKQ